MKSSITAKVPKWEVTPGELIRKGIKAKPSRRGGLVIVKLPPFSPEPGSYVIPREIRGTSARFYIDVEERTDGKKGTVACGLSGKKLPPYYIPNKGQRGRALFSVPSAVITVTGRRRDSKVTIEYHKIRYDGNIVRIESVKLWKGRLENLPKKLCHLQAAAKAAIAKAKYENYGHLLYVARS